MAEYISREDALWIAFLTNASEETKERLQNWTAANVQPVNQWISVKDRLPDPDTMVIVASYGSDIVIPEDGETVEECCKRLKKECVRVTLGFIGSDGWYDCEYCPLIVTPSFWQPLPEPPKDGDAK